MLAVLGLLALGNGSSVEAATCVATMNTCRVSDVVTTSHLQIGGEGSGSSESNADPGELFDGTVAEALYSMTFDRATGILTLQVANTTVTTSTLTGVFFNTPAEVTMLSLISHTGTTAWWTHTLSGLTSGGTGSAPSTPS
jgi:hypothetical protein